MQSESNRFSLSMRLNKQLDSLARRVDRDISTAEGEKKAAALEIMASMVTEMERLENSPDSDNAQILAYLRAHCDVAKLLHGDNSDVAQSAKQLFQEVALIIQQPAYVGMAASLLNHSTPYGNAPATSFGKGA